MDSSPRLPVTGRGVLEYNRLLVDNLSLDSRKLDILSRAREQALLIGICDADEARISVQAHLDELRNLVETLGISAKKSISLSLKSINPRYLIGNGKVDELARIIVDEEIDLVVFDSDLSPAQQRNLENGWEVTVIDRQEVILDIFAAGASTREAVLQVSLARMQYILPRLTRAWTHLSRQRGGARGNRGKGETQLETDRRLVLNKIARLKGELEKLGDQREIRRKRRVERPIPSASLVGYTNAGKSALLNSISDSDVLVRNKLFATLDPVTRRFELRDGRELLITDTVGFIRKLPHGLIEAFKSTLEEALHADVIFHVVDASGGELDEHVRVTDGVLRELGAGNKKRILVLNKADKLSEHAREELCMRYPDGLLVSARSGEGIEALLKTFTGTLNADYPIVTLNLPPARWDLRARLHRESTVLSEKYSDEGLVIRARLNSREKSRLLAYVIDTDWTPGG